MERSSPDRIEAATPSKVTATSLPFRFEPLTMASDPGETAVRSGRAAFVRLCKPTFVRMGVTGTMAGGAGVGGAGAGVIVILTGRVWRPPCGPASTFREPE